MILRFALSLLALGAAPVLADAVETVPYESLLPELTERVDFERLPQRPEPGFNLDLPVYARGAWLGERFHGQQVKAGPEAHDRIAPGPVAGWLRIVGGANRQNLSVAFHRGFGSNAVFPLGPAGFPALAARGEGALAILFDHDQPAFGFRVHTEYPDPLGTRPAVAGGIDVLVLARDGTMLSVLHHQPGPGITGYGYRRVGGSPDIAGVVITNTDPGGIAIDDIIFAMPPVLG